MKLGKKIALNTAVSVGNKFVGTFFGLLAVAIITRYLGSIGFGKYTTVTTFASVFAILADLGLTLVSSQMLNKGQSDENKIIANLLSFRLVSALMITGLAPFVVMLFPYSTDIKTGVWLAALCFLFTNFNQIFVALFQKHLRTDKIAIAEIFSRITLALGAWWVAATDAGLSGVLWAMVVANALSFLLHWLLARKFARISLGFDWNLWREIISKSWPLLTTIVLNLIYLRADIIFLTVLDDNRAVGLYGAAYKVVDVLVSLPYMFAGIILPLLVANWHSNKKQDFYAIWQKFFDLTVLVGVPLLAGGALLSLPIIKLIAGQDFLAAAGALSILMLAVLAVFLSCFYAHTMVALEKQKKTIVYYLLTAITAVPIYWFAIKHWSFYGAAWGTVYSEMVIMFGSMWAVRQEVGRLPKVKFLSQVLLASLAMSIFILCTRSLASLSNWHLTAEILIASAVYFGVLYLSGAFKKEDFVTLLSNKAGAPTVNKYE